MTTQKQDESEIKQQFADAIEKAGLVPPAISDIFEDGKRYRFCGFPGKEDDSSWYHLHIIPLESGTVYQGRFGDFRLSESFVFNSHSDNVLTAEDSQKIKEHIAEKKRINDEKTAKKHALIAKRADYIISHSAFLPGTHSYQEAKDIKGFGSERVDRYGNMVLAVYEGFGDEKRIINVQKIAPVGKPFKLKNKKGKIIEKGKIFLNGGKVKGGYHLIEGDKGGDPTVKIFVEGYATGSTACSAFRNHHVVVCFSASNIYEVVKNWRKAYPDGNFVIVADNDWATEKPIKNPGVHYAKKAAHDFNCKVIIPEFKEFIKGHTDINDLMKLEGIEVVKKLWKTKKKAKKEKKQEKSDKKTISPSGDGEITENPEKPLLQANGVDMLELSQKAWDAIVNKNTPLKYFKTLDGLTSLTSKEEYLPEMESINSDKMRYILSTCAHFYTMGKNGETPCFPPKELAANLLVFDYDLIPLPHLKKVITSPMFSTKGELHTAPGYSEKTKCFFHKADDLEIPEIPEIPSESDVIKAKKLILEIWHDFPFDSDSDRSNAIAMTIQPYVQEFISANSPMFSIIAPAIGTGKSLFVEIVALIYSGKENKIGHLTESKDDDEWRKKITTCLMKRPSIIWIDNIKRKVDSGALASALTSTVWDDRKLSTNELVRLPSDALWVCTGNNVQFSEEIARRIVPIRIDAKVERPSERDPESYLHPNLNEWVSENRGEILWACLTLAQNWFALGKPKPKNVPHVGSFEVWRQVMGGILESAGIDGFLGNLKTLYEDSDSEGDALKAMITAWYTLKGYDQSIIAGELYDLIIDQKIPVQLGGKTERGARVTLGYLLKGIKDRHFKLLIGEDTGKEDSNHETIEVVIKKAGLLHGAQKWVLKKPAFKSESLSFGTIDSHTHSPVKDTDFLCKSEYSESNECFLSLRDSGGNKKNTHHDTHDHDHDHMCESGTTPLEINTFHSGNTDKGFSGVNLPVNLISEGGEIHSLKNCTSCKLFRTNGNGRKKCFLFPENPVEMPKAGTFDCEEWKALQNEVNA